MDIQKTDVPKIQALNLAAPLAKPQLFQHPSSRYVIITSAKHAHDVLLREQLASRLLGNLLVKLEALTCQRRMSVEVYTNRYIRPKDAAVAIQSFVHLARHHPSLPPAYTALGRGCTTITTTRLAIMTANATKATAMMVPLLAGNLPAMIHRCALK